jgi:hypothetical protein
VEPLPRPDREAPRTSPSRRGIDERTRLILQTAHQAYAWLALADLRAASFLNYRSHRAPIAGRVRPATRRGPSGQPMTMDLKALKAP